MIISHSHKFVLVRPTKVASTSVHCAFKEHLVDGDIIVESPVETARDLDEGIILNAGVKMFHSIKSHPWKSALETHSSLLKIVQMFGPSILDYRIITLARNPWDRAISAFNWRHKNTDLHQKPFEEQKKAFGEDLPKAAHVRLRKRAINSLGGKTHKSNLEQAHLCKISGKFRADTVIFYERIEEDIYNTGKLLGIELRLPNERLKHRPRPTKSKSWQDYYTKETRALVARHCAEDILLFSYDFEGKLPPNWNIG